MVDIRPAERGDLPGARSVAERAWRAAHEPIVGADTVDTFLAAHYDADAFHERLDREDAAFPVAVEDGVVGYAFAPRDDATTFDLGQLYVAPDRWGEGVGGRLLEHVERAVTERGGERLTLGVMAENDRAVGFYEATGFERVDEVYDDRVDTVAAIYAKAL